MRKLIIRILLYIGLILLVFSMGFNVTDPEYWTLLILVSGVSLNELL